MNITAAEFRAGSTPTEHQIQCAYFDLVRAHERRHPALRWVYAVPNGGHRHVTVAARMKAEGVKAGVWDVCLPFPSGTAPGAYIEFKAGRNGLTEPQKAFREHLERFGYRFGVFRDAGEAWAFTVDYLRINK